jgi:hypothetical protein
MGFGKQMSHALNSRLEASTTAKQLELLAHVAHELDIVPTEIATTIVVVEVYLRAVRVPR